MIDKILKAYDDESFLKVEGLDKAIIGVNNNSTQLIYSVAKCINILCEEMSEEEALEHFAYNISGAYVGDQTPIWCLDRF